MCSGPPSASSRAIVSSRAPASTVARQSRSMTSWRNGSSTGSGPAIAAPAGPPSTRGERARCRRVDHGVDQRRLDRVRQLLRRQATVPLAYRPLDRLAGGRSAEVLHAHVVREQAWNAALEAVELGQSVFADREQEVHSEVGVVDEARELTEKRSLAVLLRVVQEVVLELIEDYEQRPHVLRPGAELLLRRPAGCPPRNVLALESLDHREPDRLHQRPERICPRQRRRRSRTADALVGPQRCHARAGAGRGSRRPAAMTSSRRRSRRRAA